MFELGIECTCTREKMGLPGEVLNVGIEKMYSCVLLFSLKSMTMVGPDINMADFTFSVFRGVSYKWRKNWS